MAKSRNDIINDMKSQTMKALNAVGRDTVTEIKDSIGTSGPKASIAPMPPHKRSGELQSSVNDRVTINGRVAILEVSVTAPYAADIEYGTERMAARPFFRPSIAKIQSKLPAALAKGG